MAAIDENVQFSIKGLDIDGKIFYFNGELKKEIDDNGHETDRVCDIHFYVPEIGADKKGIREKVQIPKNDYDTSLLLQIKNFIGFTDAEHMMARQIIATNEYNKNPLIINQLILTIYLNNRTCLKLLENIMELYYDNPPKIDDGICVGYENRGTLQGLPLYQCIKEATKNYIAVDKMHEEILENRLPTGIADNIKDMYFDKKSLDDDVLLDKGKLLKPKKSKTKKSKKTKKEPKKKSKKPKKDIEE